MRSANSFGFGILIFLTSFQVIPTFAADNMPNVNYFGQGYDITIGNPHADGHDPGFRVPIIQLSYHAKGRFLSWAVPDNLSILNATRLDHNIQSVAIDDVTDYTSSLEQDVYAIGGFEDVGQFTVNEDYKNIYKTRFECFCSQKRKILLFPCFSADDLNLAFQGHQRSHS